MRTATILITGLILAGGIIYLVLWMRKREDEIREQERKNAILNAHDNLKPGESIYIEENDLNFR